MAYLFYKQLGNHGRLGNQLFQVAATIGIARANGMDPLFPPNWKYRSVFNMPDEMFGDCFTQHAYKEPHFHFAIPELDSTKNNELIGYFQSERYFHNVSDEIKTYLTPKGSLPASMDAVCIHHRRGDYIGNPNYQQLGMNYYISAYDQIFKGKEIRAFSDDHNYIDLHYDGNTLKAKPAPEMEDFKNMIACKYHICSNSTFSWWAAYLSGSKQVIRPNLYFDGSLKERSIEKDLWPVAWHEHWINIGINLWDTTFIIPVQYDHPNRTENIWAVRNFLCENFLAHRIIGEINGKHYISDPYWIGYELPVFHRTKVLNYLTRKATTKFVINLDADAVCSPWQIYAAVEKLRNGCDIVYPFGGTVANVPRPALKPFFDTLDCGVFAGKLYPWMNSNYKSVGMAVGYNKESFLSVGGEDERHISYSAEDQCRYMKFKRLGLKVERVPGTMFHFDHWRGPDSSERHANSGNNKLLFEEELKLYREWGIKTGDADTWRPYNSITGRSENW